jgi:hypothetical protein
MDNEMGHYLVGQKVGLLVVASANQSAEMKVFQLAAVLERTEVEELGFWLAEKTVDSSETLLVGN